MKEKEELKAVFQESKSSVEWSSVECQPQIQTPNESEANKLLCYRSKESSILVVKILGPGLQLVNCIGFPYGAKWLSSYGRLFVFGDPCYGYDKIEGIEGIIAPYIEAHLIKELNVLIFAHGIIDDENKYKLGLYYDPDSQMCSPKFRPSEILTRQLESLSNLVDKTNVVSVACYGKNLLHDNEFSNFKNTLFCFFSDKDTTWQSDIGVFGGDFSAQLEQIAQGKKLGFIKDSCMSYGVNVQSKSHAPDLIYKNKKEKKAHVYTIPKNVNEIFQNDFAKQRLKQNPFIEQGKLEHKELTEQKKKSITDEIEGARTKGFLNKDNDSLISRDALAFLVIENLSGIGDPSSWKDVEDNREIGGEGFVWDAND